VWTLREDSSEALCGGWRGSWIWRHPQSVSRGECRLLSLLGTGGTESSLERKCAVTKAELSDAHTKQDGGLQKAAHPGLCKLALDGDTAASSLRSTWGERGHKRADPSVLLHRQFTTFLPSTAPHAPCLSWKPTSFSAVWKDHTSRQGMAEGKTTNELGSSFRREEVHLLCRILLFYTTLHGFVSYWMLTLPQLQVPFSRSLVDAHIAPSIWPSWSSILATSKLYCHGSQHFQE